MSGESGKSRGVYDVGAEKVLERVPSGLGLEYKALSEDDPKQRRPDITKV